MAFSPQPDAGCRLDVGAAVRQSWSCRPLPVSKGSALTAPPSPVARLGLRLLATSDLHMQIAPWDYLTDRPAPRRGLAMTARLIDTARAEVANSLLLDNGDFLQGSPLGDWVARQGRGRRHPMVAAMNALRYDAGTLGNHEFSHGLPLLRAALAEAAFPVVSANILDADGQGICPATCILDRLLCDEDGRRHPIRIGVTGFAPPQTMLWESRSTAGQLRSRDILDAARDAIAALRAAGADVIVALAHTGIDPAPPVAGMENAALPLAALDGIDALVLGHTHLTFPSATQVPPAQGHLHGKPAVMPGFHGSHLGVIDLSLERHPQGWRVTGHRAHLRSLADLAKDTPAHRAVLRAVAPTHRATRSWMASPLGHSNRPLHSHFSLIAPCDALRLVARAQARHVATRLQGTPHADLPLLSAVAPFKAGGRGGPGNYTDIPAGPLCLRHVADLYLHPNALVALRVTGAELADWLERAAALFHHVTPGGQDLPLIRDDMPSFDFDLIDGLRFAIDLSQPARFDARGTQIHPSSRRIIGLTCHGRPVARRDSFILATNSHRAAGGGGFAGTGADRIVLDTGIPVREVLAAHVAAGGATETALTGFDWRFAPMPGTTVTFDTAPAALRHRDSLPAPHPEPLGPTPEGFLRFRLRL